MKKYLWLVICNLLFVASCHKKEVEIKAPAIEVTKGNVEEVVEEIGVLTPATLVEVRSEISGQVTEILAEVGDFVRKDQVLARVRGGFEAEEFRTAEIRSPIAGMVVDRKTADGRKVEVGDRIRDSLSGFASGTVLMKVAKLDRLFFDVEINEMDAPRVRRGQGCEVMVDAIPGRIFRGKLARISPSGSQGKKGVNVFDTEVAILDHDENLRPGMTARAKIVVDGCGDCPRLSLTRLYTEKCGGKTVSAAYVEGKAGKAPERRILQTQANDGNYVGIKDGLAVGDKVVQRPEGRPSPEECAEGGGKGAWGGGDWGQGKGGGSKGGGNWGGGGGRRR